VIAVTPVDLNVWMVPAVGLFVGAVVFLITDKRRRDLETIRAEEAEALHGLLDTRTQQLADRTTEINDLNTRVSMLESQIDMLRSEFVGTLAHEVMTAVRDGIKTAIPTVITMSPQIQAQPQTTTTTTTG